MSTVLIDLSMLAVTATRTRGIGRHVTDLVRALGTRAAVGGDGTAILAIERLPWWGAARVTADIEGAIGRLTDGAFELSQAAWAYRVRFHLAAAARLSGAEVVHSPDPDATPLGRLRCPRVVTCHDLINLMFPGRYTTWRDGWSLGRRRLDAHRYHHASHVIAVSETTAHELVARLRVPARNITVVRNGVDLTRFSPTADASDAAVRARCGVGDRPYLLYVGGADWRKNPEGMFDALVRLRRRAGSDAPLLAWVGRLEGRDLTSVRRLVAAYGIGDAVRLIGWIPDADLAALARAAVALLFVSRAEGFGYPVIEAMASGCPVVAGNSPAIAEIAGDAARFVDPERADAIADAVATLLRDASERRRCIDRGLARCRAFDVARMADETLDVYRRVASAGSRRPRPRDRHLALTS